MGEDFHLWWKEARWIKHAGRGRRRRHHGAGEKLREGLAVVATVGEETREKGHGTGAETTVEKGVRTWRQSDGWSHRWAPSTRRRFFLPRWSVSIPTVEHTWFDFYHWNKKATWKKEIKLQTLATFSLSVSCCLYTTNKGSKSFKHFCSVCLMVSCLRFFGCVGFGGSEREISKQKVHALVPLLWKRRD